MSDPRNNGENTPRQMPEGKRFQPGNPGRPKGSRNKLGEAFISDLYADWQEHGMDALVRVRRDKPEQYVKVVASILPKQLEIKDGAFDDIADDELALLIATARKAISAAEGGGERKRATAH